MSDIYETSHCQEVKHYQVNGRYRIQYERSATKGVDGFKIEVNSDSLDEVVRQANYLREEAIKATEPPIFNMPNVKIPPDYNMGQDKKEK